MKKNLPPLTWFRSFEAAARTLSFTAAADEIGLTQSAVSQQIKSLETRLRIQLFQRLPRGLALTDAGRKLLPEVETALDLLGAATAQHLAPTGKNALTIAASISMIEWVLAPRLSEFQALRPEAEVIFQATIWPDEYSAPVADIEIRFGSPKQVGNGATGLPSVLLPVKSPGLTGRLESLPTIGTLGTSVGWDGWSQSAGIPMQPPKVRIDSYGQALKFAMEGVGVALVDSIIAEQALRAGQVVPAHPHAISGKERYFVTDTIKRSLAGDFLAWFAPIWQGNPAFVAALGGTGA